MNVIITFGAAGINDYVVAPELYPRPTLVGA